MGYNTNRAPAATATEANWKADAFLNIWVSRKDGSRMKVGAIPLKMARAAEAALIERLKEQGAVDAFKSAVEFDFQMAEASKPRADFAF